MSVMVSDGTGKAVWAEMVNIFEEMIKSASAEALYMPRCSGCHLVMGISMLWRKESKRRILRNMYESWNKEC